MMDNTSSNILKPQLQLVAWEITRSCNLYCAHCRASANESQCAEELTTLECYGLVDQILEVGHPILILTGGEPLRRPDIFQVGRYAAEKGLRVVMGTNGTLITEEVAAKMKAIPLSRISVSLDFPNPELQDKFRGKPGAYEAALKGIQNAQKAGVEIQINCTLTQMNVQYLDEMVELALKLGAVAFHPFLLVPTGRGKGLESVELTPQQYEETLNHIYDKQNELGNKLFFKPTDAPHYVRIMKQRQKPDQTNTPATQGDSPAGRHHPTNSISRGCLAGTGFCFISHTGRVQGCGYLDVEAGNIRKQPFNKIWNDSPLFINLRNLENLKGKCGNCEFKRVCGGCRARAFEATGNYLESEPYCIYQPVNRQKDLTGV
jgi:AdoMet-dependent heme synthase